MKAIEQLERLKRMNELIKAECTGTPEEFSNRLGISRSQMYNLIEDFKILGASIKYSRLRQSFYYPIEFEIQLQYKISFVQNDKLKIIEGGFVNKCFCPILLDGRNLF